MDKTPAQREHEAALAASLKAARKRQEALIEHMYRGGQPCVSCYDAPATVRNDDDWLCGPCSAPYR